jgi:hypothetical protein
LKGYGDIVFRLISIRIENRDDPVIYLACTADHDGQQTYSSSARRSFNGHLRVGRLSGF